MRKFWETYKTVIFLFILWRLLLFVIERFSRVWFPVQSQFLEPVRWANFDGGHYLHIAGSGYGIFEQAFFPLYPILIRSLTFLPVAPVYIGILISHTALFAGVLVLWALIRKERLPHGRWIILFLLFFPTGFFFASVYPTSLLFFLTVASVYAIRCNRWRMAGFFGLLASATHLFGVLLFPVAVWEYLKTPSRDKRTMLSLALFPLGLIFYMGYLFMTTGDAFAFIHVQSAYGANRTGEGIVLLPQVMWRYAKMLRTVSPQSFLYAVATFELSIFALCCVLCVRAVQQRLRISYILFSVLILIIPTLTGTLSSLPRYALSAFPLFFVLGTMHNNAIKAIASVVMTAGLVICTLAYLQGYFIA